MSHGRLCGAKNEVFGGSPDFTIVIVPLSVQGTSILSELHRIIGKINEDTAVEHSAVPGAG